MNGGYEWEKRMRRWRNLRHARTLAMINNGTVGNEMGLGILIRYASNHN